MKGKMPTKKEVIAYFKGVKTISSKIWPDLVVKLPKKMNVVKMNGGYQVEYKTGHFTFLYCNNHGYSNIESMTKKGYKMIDDAEFAFMNETSTVVIRLTSNEIERMADLLIVHDKEILYKMAIIEDKDFA
jgi:hypothetical protein